MLKNESNLLKLTLILPPHRATTTPAVTTTNNYPDSGLSIQDIEFLDELSTTIHPRKAYLDELMLQNYENYV